jgi:hypothetical protein
MSIPMQPRGKVLFAVYRCWNPPPIQRRQPSVRCRCRVPVFYISHELIGEQDGQAI